MNNEMDDFSIKPGTANQFGLVGGKANAIEPGKRMLSSMTPTIFERNSELFLVLGSPGGSQIITSVLQVFLQVAEQGLTVADAVKAPRFHHQWLPDKIQMEANGFDPEIIQQLESLGHKVEVVDRIGLVKAILVNIFGGIVRCDRVAQGVIDAYRNMGDAIKVPIIVRLQGTNADIAKELIDNSGLDVQSAVEFQEAADKVQAVLA